MHGRTDSRTHSRIHTVDWREGGAGNPGLGAAAATAALRCVFLICLSIPFPSARSPHATASYPTRGPTAPPRPSSASPSASTSASFPLLFVSPSLQRKKERAHLALPGGIDTFAKVGGGFGALGMAPAVHDFASGFGATTQDNGDDDTVPWIHYPIIDDEDAAAPAALAAADYGSDFFSELQAAAAAAAAAAPPTDLASLPASNHNGATNNRNAPVATSTTREPSKESHGGLSVPTTRAEPQPQPQLAAAKLPRSSGSGGGEGVMNFSLFSRPAVLARATLESAQRTQGTDNKASNVTASNRVESTVVQTASGPRSAPAFADQRAAAWPPQPKEMPFASTAAAPMAPAVNLHHEMGRDRAGRTMPVHKTEARKAPEATVATSSVCSGNGAGSDELWRQQKRKCQAQAECSASQDDVSKWYEIDMHCITSWLYLRWFSW